jgi:tRNA threonylcarbamoyladenosine biosynthesis protein TsaB
VILALDTATTPASIAVTTVDGTLRALRVLPSDRQPASTLFPTLAAVLAEAHTGMSAMTCLAVCHGPGSYTGIRMGLAAVAGLWAARHVPVVAVSALEAWAMLAASAGQSATCVQVGDGAGGWAQQCFDPQGIPMTPIASVIAAASDAAAPLPAGMVAVGPGWGVLTQPLAEAVAQVAARRRLTTAAIKAGATQTCHAGTAASRPAPFPALLPLYLRPSYAEIAAGDPFPCPR